MGIKTISSPASPCSVWEVRSVAQLDSLRVMFNDRRKDTPKDNFLYMVYRALHLMGAHMAPTEFGETSIATPEQLQRWFLRRQLEGQF